MTTHAILFLSDLDPQTTGDACAHATHYEAVPVSAFRALIGHVPDAAIRSSTFVDLGAGMGRALLLASEYPFKQILGVELSPSLYEVARENLANARELRTRCRDVRLVRADARHYEFPRGDLVVFLYNPFDGEALDDVLDRLAADGATRTIWVLYHTPVHADVLLARGYERIAQYADGEVYRARL